MSGSSRVIAFLPADNFLNLSISGTYCELNCPYCKGEYLRGMTDVSDPEMLKKVLNFYYSKGVRGYLISGGFNREGYLLLKKDHLRVIREFKKDKEVVFSIHLGLAPEELVEEVWSSGIDYVDFELPPSNKYVKYMKNLPGKELTDYLSLLQKLLDYSRSFAVPHLVIDSVMASQDEELSVMKAVSELRPTLFISLIEIRKTRNNFDRVHEALKLARKLFRETSLGCMRPIRFKEYDRVFIEEGLLDRIAVPRPQLIRELKLPVIKACCGIPKDKFFLFPLIMH